MCCGVRTQIFTWLSIFSSLPATFSYWFWPFPGAGVRSDARRSIPAGGTSAASSAAQSSTISAHRFAANSSPAAFTGEDVYYTLCTGSLVNSLMDSSVPDPWHFGVETDPDPDTRIHASDKWIRIWILDRDPAIFVIDLQDASKKLIFNTIFPAYYFLKVHLHHFSK